MTRPTAHPVNVDHVPAELIAERRWTCWRYVRQRHDGDVGRWIKLPVARTNDPATWTTFDDAVRRIASGDFNGVGFVLGDGWAGLDLDHCLDSDAAAGALARLADLGAYREVSPSGTGVKVIGRADRVGGEVNFATTPPTFTAWTGARYFTVTGAVVSPIGSVLTDLSALIAEWFPSRAIDRRDVPSFIRPGDTRGLETIERRTDDEVVARILASPQADKFAALVRGDLTAYGGDHSRADQALVTILAYWCEGDLEQVDRLFRESGLMRDKWNASSYRRATLAKAVAR